jgi:hypothetical protein
MLTLSDSRLCEGDELGTRVLAACAELPMVMVTPGASWIGEAAAWPVTCAGARAGGIGLDCK